METESNYVLVKKGDVLIFVLDSQERDLDSRSRKSDVTTGRRHKRDPGTWAEKRVKKQRTRSFTLLCSLVL